MSIEGIGDSSGEQTVSFILKACTVFSAAHTIHGHKRCGRIHGHNYRVCIWVSEREPLEIDLDYLEEWLRENVYKKFDHQYLNQLLGGREATGITAEYIAEYIASMLEKDLPGRVLRVEVCETNELCAIYKPAKDTSI